jgi:hypothetical protein
MEIPSAVKEALQVGGGNLETVRLWWRSPIPEMGGVSPEQLVANGRDQVLMVYLASVESGFIG